MPAARLNQLLGDTSERAGLFREGRTEPNISCVAVAIGTRTRRFATLGACRPRNEEQQCLVAAEGAGQSESLIPCREGSGCKSRRGLSARMKARTVEIGVSG
jgi:hypothetical protein